MAAKPQRRRQPLEASGRADRRIIRHRIIARVVEEVGQLVDVSGPGLDCLLPPAITPDACGPARSEHAHDLFHGDLAPILHNDQVDQVIAKSEDAESSTTPAVEALSLDIVSAAATSVDLPNP
jgi:hypothetical protein